MTKKEKLIAEYKAKMLEQVNNDDTEQAHSNADSLLVELLELLGYKEVTDVYDEVGKWYA